MTKKVLLVSPLEDFLINPKAFPPLGVLYLSAYLKKNAPSLEVEVVHGNPQDIKQHYDLIGISSTTPQYPKAKKFLDYIRENELANQVILGGPHTTAPNCAAEAVQHGFDYVVRGQGEKALASIVNGDTLPKIVNGISLDQSEIDSISPDRKALNMREYGYPLEGEKAMTLMTSRGCPYKCSFCTINSGKVVFRAPEKVLEEIRSLQEEYGCSRLLFLDDSFTFNKKRLRTILGGIQDVKYRCYARADNSTDEELLKLMLKSGCVELGAGIETGSQDILDLVHKKTKIADNLKFIQMVKELGINMNAFIMIGLPGETQDTIKQTRDFMLQAQPQRFGYNIFAPFPDSEIVINYEVPFRTGRYRGKSFKDFITLYPMPYELALTKSKSIDACFVSTPGLSREDIVAAYHQEFETFVSISGFDPRKR